ncbi:hypothetical protein SpCBS45565_g00876 [Spizellomyces sp. 'palustris']|nr:hypothetical protein SpCBS45565_g00876 [Spizellomyces sp. 'palustris']
MSAFWPFSGWSLPQTLQKRLLKFLLKRAIGQFLASELNLENLDVELGKGQVVLKDLELNLEVLNDLAADLPVIVTDGRISRIQASVPWKDLGTSDCILEFDGLYLELMSLREDPENGLSRSSQMSESHIMSSSIHFAENFLRSEVSDEDDLGLAFDRKSNRSSANDRPTSTSFSTNQGTPPSGSRDTGLEGLQVLARLIDKILAKVKVVAKNTIIRLSHRSQFSIAPTIMGRGDSPVEYHLDLTIPTLSYGDETLGLGDDESDPLHSTTVKITKVIRFSGTSITLSQLQDGGESSVTEYAWTDVLATTSSDQENWARIIFEKSLEEPLADSARLDSSVNRAVQNSGMRIDCFLDSICALIDPSQMALLKEILAAVREGQDMLTYSRQFGMAGESISGYGEPPPLGELGVFASRSDQGPGAWPGTANSPQTPVSLPPNSFSTEVPISMHLHLRQCDIYLPYQIPPLGFDKSQLYKVYFSGRSSAPATGVPSDMSTSFVTQMNTRLNAGNGALDEVIAGILGANHLKIGVENIVVDVSTSESNANQDVDHILEVSVGNLSIQEWMEHDLRPASTGRRRPSKGAYSRIVFFDPGVKISQVAGLYNQLKTCQPPRAEVVYDFPGRPSNVQMKTPAIRCTFESATGPNTAHTWPDFGSAMLRHMNVELSPLHLFFDIEIMERVSRLFSGKAGTGEVYGDNPSAHEDDPFQRTGTAVGFIMDDLTQSASNMPAAHVDYRISVKTAVCRCWLTLPRVADGIRNGQERPLRGRHSDMLLVDFTDSSIATSTGPSGRSNTRRSSLGSLHQRVPSTCCSGDQRETRRWVMDCQNIGVALARRVDGEKVAIKAFASCGSFAPESAGTSAPVPTRPNFEVTVRSHICDSLLERPTADVFATPTGLTFNREVDDDVSGGFGFQSWYDIGSTGRSPRSPSDHGTDEKQEDLLWFKHRTIEESLIHLNCYFPICHLNLIKADYDLLQVLINEITLFQSISKTEEQPSSSSPPQTATANLLKFGQLPDVDSQPTQSKLRPEIQNSNSVNEVPQPWGGHSNSKVVRKPSAFSAVATCDSFRASVHLEVQNGAEATNIANTSYSCALDDLHFFLINGHMGKHTSYVWIDADDLSFNNVASPLNPAMTYLYRTLPKNFEAKQMLSISSLMAYDEELNMKETTASINLNAFTVRYVMGSPVIPDLGAFLKEPSELVFVDMANRFTKLYVNLTDVCVDYQPLHMPIRSVLLVDSAKISCNLIPESPTIGLKILVYNSSVLVAEDDLKRRHSENESHGADGYINTRKHFTSLGFANVGGCDFLDISVRTNSGSILPYLEVDITNNQLSIDTCADTYLTLLALIKYLTEAGDLPKETTEELPVPRTPEQKMQNPLSDQGHDSDLLASLDEEAFKGQKGKKVATSSVYLQMEDVDDALSQSVLIQFDDEDGSFSPTSFDEFDFGITGSPTLSSPQTARANQSTATEAKEGAVYLLEDPAAFHIIDDFFSRPLLESDMQNASTMNPTTNDKCLTRIRIRDFDVSWKIYDGYDWNKTREAVFELSMQAAKGKATNWKNRESGTGRTGRRESPVTTTTASSYEFDVSSEMSYRNDENIGFEIGNYFLPTLQQPLPQLSDEQRTREQERDETASVHSNTSNLSARSRDTTATSMSTAQRKRPTSTDDLVRSQTSQLIFKAYALNIDYDLFPDEAQTAWRLLLTVRDFEIIDNVRTSRWRKFLSYLRPDGDALPRETSSNMIRADLSSVDLLPLRMHIDQDALSCLLRFFAFEAPPSDDAVGPKKSDNTFFQLCDIQPVSVKVDYKPKHVDYANLKGGNFIEIMNFFQLDGAEMTLRGVRLTGVKGWTRLMEGILSQWLPHIRDTQVPRVVSGVSGVRSLVNIGSGLADLVLLPIEQYKKDGRIIRGLQKGARSFAKAATTETIKLGTKLAVGTQVLLEHADEILTGDDASRHGDDVSRSSSWSSSLEQVSKYSEQPRDVKEGVELAYRSLSRNVATAARTVFAVPMEVYENNGAQGTVRAVIRAVPVAVLKPMIGATEAVSKTLMGLQNTIDPSKRLQMEDKYKG